MVTPNKATPASSSEFLSRPRRFLIINTLVIVYNHGI
jgi:hypothetical protein